MSEADRETLTRLYTDADGMNHGFVLSNGAYAAVDVPGAVRTEIYSINAKGEIAGVYEGADGVQHGFVGVPAR